MRKRAIRVIVVLLSGTAAALSLIGWTAAPLIAMACVWVVASSIVAGIIIATPEPPAAPEPEPVPAEMGSAEPVDPMMELKWLLFTARLPHPSAYREMSIRDLFADAKRVGADTRRCAIESRLDLMGVPNASQVVEEYLGDLLED